MNRKGHQKTAGEKAWGNLVNAISQSTTKEEARAFLEQLCFLEIRDASTKHIVWASTLSKMGFARDLFQIWSNNDMINKLIEISDRSGYERDGDFQKAINSIFNLATRAYKEDTDLKAQTQGFVIKVLESFKNSNKLEAIAENPAIVSTAMIAIQNEPKLHKGVVKELLSLMVKQRRDNRSVLYQANCGVSSAIFEAAISTGDEQLAREIWSQISENNKRDIAKNSKKAMYTLSTCKKESWHDLMEDFFEYLKGTIPQWLKSNDKHDLGAVVIATSSLSTELNESLSGILGNMSNIDDKLLLGAINAGCLPKISKEYSGVMNIFDNKKTMEKVVLANKNKSEWLIELIKSASAAANHPSVARKFYNAVVKDKICDGRSIVEYFKAGPAKDAIDLITATLNALKESDNADLASSFFEEQRGFIEENSTRLDDQHTALMMSGLRASLSEGLVALPQSIINLANDFKKSTSTLTKEKVIILESFSRSKECRKYITEGECENLIKEIELDKKMSKREKTKNKKKTENIIRILKEKGHEDHEEDRHTKVRRQERDEGQQSVLERQQSRSHREDRDSHRLGHKRRHEDCKEDRYAKIRKTEERHHEDRQSRSSPSNRGCAQNDNYCGRSLFVGRPLDMTQENFLQQARDMSIKDLNTKTVTLGSSTAVNKGIPDRLFKIWNEEGLIDKLIEFSDYSNPAQSKFFESAMNSIFNLTSKAYRKDPDLKVRAQNFVIKVLEGFKNSNKLERIAKKPAIIATAMIVIDDEPELHRGVVKELLALMSSKKSWDGHPVLCGADCGHSGTIFPVAISAGDELLAQKIWGQMPENAKWYVADNPKSAMLILSDCKKHGFYNLMEGFFEYLRGAIPQWLESGDKHDLGAVVIATNSLSTELNESLSGILSGIQGVESKLLQGALRVGCLPKISKEYSKIMDIFDNKKNMKNVVLASKENKEWLMTLIKSASAVANHSTVAREFYNAVVKDKIYKGKSILEHFKTVSAKDAIRLIAVTLNALKELDNADLASSFFKEQEVFIKQNSTNLDSLHIALMMSGLRASLDEDLVTLPQPIINLANDFKNSTSASIKDRIMILEAFINSKEYRKYITEKECKDLIEDIGESKEISRADGARTSKKAENIIRMLKEKKHEVQASVTEKQSRSRQDDRYAEQREQSSHTSRHKRRHEDCKEDRYAKIRKTKERHHGDRRSGYVDEYNDRKERSRSDKNYYSRH